MLNINRVHIKYMLQLSISKLSYWYNFDSMISLYKYSFQWKIKNISEYTVTSTYIRPQFPHIWIAVVD